MIKNKKVLFIIPDYNLITLRSVALFLQLDYQVELAAPYNYRMIPFFLKYIKFGFIKRIYNRRRAVDRIINLNKISISIISISLFDFVYILYNDYFKLNKPFSNILKDILQIKVREKIDYSKYDLVYCFDTVAYLFQKDARKFGVDNCLEVRGAHYQYSLEVNKRMNQIYNTAIFDIDRINDSADTKWWYEKLISEPRLANFLVCYSDFHKNMYLNYSKIAESKVLVNPLLSNISKSNNIKRIIDEKISFVFVGNLSYVKGIPLLITAWNNMLSKIDSKKAELHLYGSMQIIEISSMLENSVNIFYHGIKEHNKLINILKSKHHVFIFPTMFDTFGLALQEALQLNFPIISNYTCGAAELFEDEIHGFKYEDSYNIDEIEACMMKYINNPELVEKHSIEVNKLKDFSKENKFDNPITALSR